jgi:tetratricopeptide (TPR) repeat protein
MGFARAILEWDWERAEADFHRAIELDPKHATAYHWYAVYCLAPRLRHAEALLAMEQAVQLEPASVAIRAHHGWILYFQRCYEDALVALGQCAALDPTSYLPDWYRGFVHEQLADTEAAHEFYARSHKLASRELSTLGTLGRIQGLLGNRKKALGILRRLQNAEKRRYPTPVDSAHVRIGLGQPDRAMEELERACESRCSRLIHIKADPAFDCLKANPQFIRILARMGLGSD